MGTAIDFPYNQTVQAFAPTSGTYKNVTFVLCNTSNGLGGGQLQPTGTGSNSSVNYQSPTPFPYNIDAEGSSNSALCFVPNPQGGWINQAPPYYFVSGSTAGNIWLYTLTPAAGGDDFTKQNIVCQGKIGSMNSAIASLYYYASLNLLFAAGDNGDIDTYTVSWSNGAPSFTHQGSNTNYDSPTGCAVSICFFYNSTTTPTTTNATNQYGQYIPAGSYQGSSSAISITLSAQCTNASGQTGSSSLTFTAAEVGSIGDISNDNGNLKLISGSNSSVNATNKYGQYVPAGSYQNSSSDIMVTISATCSSPNGATSSSSLVYSSDVASTIVDITNNNSELALITPVFLIVSGLSIAKQNGSFYFPLSTANNGVLPNALGMLGSATNTVATVVDQPSQTIYIASQSEVVALPFSNLQAAGTSIWSASDNNQLILSMAGIMNPQGYTYNGNFGNGALVVGTVSNTSSASNTTPGSLYALDPITAYSYTLADATLSGSPYSLFADANYHLLVNYGSTGLDLYTLPTDDSAQEPIALIPNVTPPPGWLYWLVDGLVVFAVLLVASVLTDGAGDAAVITDVVADEVASDGAASAAGDAVADGGGDVVADGGGDAEGDGAVGNEGDGDAASSNSDSIQIGSDGSVTGSVDGESVSGNLSEDWGGTFYIDDDDGLSYPYYIDGNVLDIPEDTPANLITALKSIYGL